LEFILLKGSGGCEAAFKICRLRFKPRDNNDRFRNVDNILFALISLLYHWYLRGLSWMMADNGNADCPKEREEPKQEIAQVSLKVVNADGAEMYFKIKRGTQMKKLMDAYCKRQGVNRTSVRFLFDGSPIDENKTPDDLGMEDDDVIDAMVEQTGGLRFPRLLR
jgi:small ubiquitin-related modifier